MRLPLNDADVERIVVDSGLVSGVRRALAWAARVCAGSTAVAVAMRPWPASVVARVLVVASLVHAAMIALVPSASAPVGRYLFAIAGLAAGALLFAASRRESRH